MNEKRIQEIQDELAEISNKRNNLLDELKIYQETSSPNIRGTSLQGHDTESYDGRIHIFLKLFRARNDLYPHFWQNSKTGKKGYSAVCFNEWKDNICFKPRIKCRDCHYQGLRPFDKTVAEDHLLGRDIVGSYAIRGDDTCIFLMIDFDKKSWQRDALSFKNTARTIGVETAIERSHSEHGAHVWIFFSDYIPANKARQLGFLILGLSNANNPTLSLDSYDRLHPNQGTLPKGSFGNHVALPLQKNARDKGHTMFVDDNYQVIENQWKYLTQIKRPSREDVNDLLEKYLPSNQHFFISEEDGHMANAEKIMDIAVEKIIEEKFHGKLNIKLKEQLYVQDIDKLPDKVLFALKRSATFANPEFYKRQKMRFSTWNTPSYLCYSTIDANTLILPRGNLDFCRSLAKDIGATLIIDDLRPQFKEKNIGFTGQLRKDQMKAVEEVFKHEMGVLVAPPGVGKTVMGCYLIAQRKVSTLIIVHRRTLMEQWRQRLSSFLDIDPQEIGVYEGKKRTPGGKVDIAMVQTMTNMQDADEHLSRYGQVIIDEGHHIPAVSFESLLKKIPAKYILGLTATPMRKDGLQPIIFMQCGPIRCEMEEYGAKSLIKTAIIKETHFQLKTTRRQLPIHEIWDQLIKCPERLDIIAKDIDQGIQKNGRILILSDRKEHLALLACAIKRRTKAEQLILIGDMNEKQREKVFEKIKNLTINDKPFYLLSTGPLIGEGIDLPMLDRLVLAMPFSYEGRLKQFIGRIHRPFKNKKNVYLYDYFDENMGLTVSMIKNRIKAYKKMGYTIKHSNLKNAYKLHDPSYFPMQ